MFKISVIIPVYKVKDSLLRCVDSVCNQTYRNLEIILVDDGSPDECPAMCDELQKKDDRIKVVHRTNGGLGMARNSGMEIATGDYIGFVDSDDYVHKDMFRNLIEAAETNSLDAAYSGFYKESSDGSICERPLTKTFKLIESPEYVCSFLMNLFASEPSCPKDSLYGATVWKAIFSKKIIDQYSIRFYSEREYVSEDGLFDIDFLTKAKKIGIIPGCFYYYVYNPKSLTSSYRAQRFEQNKALFALGRKKLWDAYMDESIISQYDRMFIAASRVCVIQEVWNGRKCGFFNSLRNVKKICKDPVTCEVLKRYPWGKLPIKNKIFTFFMNYKCSFLLYILVRFRYSI